MMGKRKALYASLSREEGTMEEMLEIRWHGREGQGEKTAALLLGEAVVQTGKYMQAFPDYGPERMGAPMRAYNRISNDPIRIHSGVTSPKVVAVLDSTLLGKVDVTQGMHEDGILLVNTSHAPGEIRSKLQLMGKRVYTIDANRISLELLGRPMPNTRMLGALIKVTAVVGLEELIDDTRRKLEKKFKHRPEVIAGNLQAIRRAFQEVRAE